MSPARYAIYFAPDPASPLWGFGSAVIGYDAATGADPQQLVPPGYAAEEWLGLTAEPRRYGFHATMKAPFRLPADIDEDALVAALREFVRTEAPFTVTLQMSVLGDFVALTPAGEAPAIAALERRVVEGFERFRAPLTEDELARRLRSPLSARQRDLLARYGYPYVHEEFRFHMTLTGRVPRPLEIAAALDDGVPQTRSRDAGNRPARRLQAGDRRGSLSHLCGRGLFAALTTRLRIWRNGSDRLPGAQCRSVSRRVQFDASGGMPQTRSTKRLPSLTRLSRGMSPESTRSLRRLRALAGG